MSDAPASLSYPTRRNPVQSRPNMNIFIFVISSIYSFLIICTSPFAPLLSILRSTSGMLLSPLQMIKLYFSICFFWQWNYAYQASWSACSWLLKIRNFCGLWFLPLAFYIVLLISSSYVKLIFCFAGVLLPNVPGIGPYRFLAWACIFTSKFTEFSLYHSCYSVLTTHILISWSHATASLQLEGFVII
jgi:hypothetical protein